MKISIGIIGLPNVGKSTLFNALLKKQIANVANYPFCTIDPNVGVIEVPDERLSVLAKIVNTQKIIPAVVEFYDIAGLVKGASKGEGLGNQFLSHIREVSAIIHVVRLFEDENVIHVDNKLDQVSDVRTIETELILADLATVAKQSSPRMNSTKEERFSWEIIQKVKEGLDKGILIRKMNLPIEEQDAVKHLNLLTVKPVIYAFNVSENQLTDKEKTESKIRQVMIDIADDANFLPFCAKLETEVLALDKSEQVEYLKQFNLTQTGLDRMVQEAYHTLGLISFLTAGEKEARAWTIEKGTTSLLASGTIHTDFIKHFIKADIISFADFVAQSGWANARTVGKVLTVGKDYIMKDGDVVEFKIGN